MKQSSVLNLFDDDIKPPLSLSQCPGYHQLVLNREDTNLTYTHRCVHTHAWTRTHTHPHTHPPTDLGPIGILLSPSLGQRAGQQIETLVSSWYYHQLILKRQEHRSHSNVLNSSRRPYSRICPPLLQFANWMILPTRFILWFVKLNN